MEGQFLHTIVDESLKLSAHFVHTRIVVIVGATGVVRLPPLWDLVPDRIREAAGGLCPVNRENFRAVT